MDTHDHDDTRVLPELREQLGLPLAPRDTYFSAPEIDLSEYDHIIIGMSGGKDSIAALLRLLDLGVDRDRLELWHHDVDGREGSTLMDWPFTPMATSNSPTCGHPKFPQARRADYDDSGLMAIRAAASLRR